jgi:GAF domain-containing protein
MALRPTSPHSAGALPRSRAESEGREQPLIRTFVELADTLTEDYDLADFLYRLLVHCTQLFDAPAAGIQQHQTRGGIELAASSSETAEHLELFQLQIHTGPCLECATAAVAVRSGDLAADPARWAGWSEAALAGGFRSVYATPMTLRGQTVGAFNLFCTIPDALSDADLAVVQALADIATIGILQERAIAHSETLSEQLQVALDSRILIEQAKGVVAGRTDLDVSPDRAFLLLRDLSRRTNTKLGVVCQAVVDGTLSPVELLAS